MKSFFHSSEILTVLLVMLVIIPRYVRVVVGPSILKVSQVYLTFDRVRA